MTEKLRFNIRSLLPSFLKGELNVPERTGIPGVTDSGNIELDQSKKPYEWKVEDCDEFWPHKDIQSGEWD